MPTTEKLTVYLPAEIIAEVRQAIEAGEYGSGDEVVREALEDWRTRRDSTLEETAGLRQAIQEAEEYGGPGEPMEEAMDRLEAKYTALYLKDTVRGQCA